MDILTMDVVYRVPHGPWDGDRVHEATSRVIEAVDTNARWRTNTFDDHWNSVPALSVVAPKAAED
ncbi:hypothetical protein [Actinomadura violacea]|uniref:Uncharacterized protein n=1 Tax=Actinomadura violacea TaxID=2819934 RepID=A0ABS3S6R2_9ACTN|nr:hypothetical protein [Actinomadura violacea]MBO2464698.1 hypothetical protein [Actinomadura violacea]